MEPFTKEYKPFDNHKRVHIVPKSHTYAASEILRKNTTSRIVSETLCDIFPVLYNNEFCIQHVVNDKVNGVMYFIIFTHTSSFEVVWCNGFFLN